MHRADLRAFVSRSRAILETAPPETVAEIRSWLVEPLLEALGWSVHATACEIDATVHGREIDYLLAVEDTPAVAVFVRGSPTGLEEADGAVRRLMAATGIDRVVLTDGRTVALYAGVREVDRFHCSIDSVAENADAFAHYTESRCRRRLERQSRALAARRLAADRSTLASTVAAELSAVAGEAYADEFERAAGGFVDDLIDSLRDASRGGAPPAGGHETHPEELGAGDTERGSTGANLERAGSNAGTRGSVDPAGGRTDADESTSSDPDSFAADSAPVDALPPTGETSRSSSSSDRGGAHADAVSGDRKGGSNGPSAADSDAGDVVSDPTDGDAASPASVDASSSDASADREYVVRFFADRGSIGAIGHSRSDEALVQAVEFCLERGLSGIRLPWDHDDATVVNDAPVRADGSPMVAPRELSNGWVVDVGDDPATRADRVEAVASRAGLRVMLTGDWPSGDES